MSKLCLPSKGSLLSPQLVARSATFNWNLKYAQSTYLPQHLQSTALQG